MLHQSAVMPSEEVMARRATTWLCVRWSPCTPTDLRAQWPDVTQALADAVCDFLRIASARQQAANRHVGAAGLESNQTLKQNQKYAVHITTKQKGNTVLQTASGCTGFY